MFAMIFVYVVAGIFSGKKAHVDRKNKHNGKIWLY